MLSSDHGHVLSIIANPQYNANMKPVDLPVVSGPNTHYGRNFKTTREGIQIIFVGLYVAEHPTQGVEEFLPFRYT